MCFFSKNIDPMGGNHYELDIEEAVGGANPVIGDNPVEGDNAYDTVWPKASGSKSEAPKNEGNTVC